MEKYTRIGEMIKGERKKHRISLRDFCRSLDQSSVNISELERGIIDYTSGVLLLGKISEILKLSIEERRALFELEKLSNKIEQPHELIIPFPRKAFSDHQDKVKVVAILNIERLDNKNYRDEICETLTTFEQEVLFEYFEDKVQMLKCELQVAKCDHDFQSGMCMNCGVIEL